MAVPRDPEYRVEMTSPEELEDLGLPSKFGSPPVLLATMTGGQGMVRIQNTAGRKVGED